MALFFVHFYGFDGSVLSLAYCTVGSNRRHREKKEE